METNDEGKNYINPQESEVEYSIERAGSLTNEPAENLTKDKKFTSKLANLLEGLEFPANKKNILDHINRKSPFMGNKTNDVFESMSNNLKEGIKYKNVYEIGLDAQIVEKL